MKRNLFYFLIFCLIGTVTVSCNKKDDETPIPETEVVGNNSQLFVVADKAISKKWIVNNNAKKNLVKIAEDASDYAWIELSPYGMYIIMKTDGSVIDGTYSYDSVKNEIILDGFGEIVITNISSSQFTFTLTPTGGTPIDFNTSAGTAISSPKTSQFARIWNLTKQTEDGVETDILSKIDSAYLIVTKYGTHMLVLKGGFNDMHIPQTWQWSDGTQAKICVGDTQPDCNADKLTITLTSTDKLIVEYPGEVQGTVTREEYEEIILL